jgi:hypothetical protein
MGSLYKPLLQGHHGERHSLHQAEVVANLDLLKEIENSDSI